MSDAGAEIDADAASNGNRDDDSTVERDVQADGCTLCDLPLPETAVQNDDGEAFCCRGCRQVHETLAERDDLSVDDDPAVLTEEVEEQGTDTPEGYETDFLRIDGMHCATCETFIESRAAGTEGVGTVDASYITDTARIDYDPDVVSEAELQDSLTGMGYRAYAKDDPMGRREAEDRLLFRLIVGVVFGMMVMLNYVAIIYPTYFDSGLYYPPEVADFLGEMIASTSAAYFYIVLAILSSVVLFVTGGPILKGAYVSIRTREPNMDLLVALAATSAWAYSTVAIFVGNPHIYYDVTVGIIVVVTAGSYYESGIKRQATDRLADLTVTQVDEARRYAPDESTTTVAVSDLEGGDTVLVREGERIPLNGTVVEGTGTVDEAVVTGESLPVGKTADDDVIGGSLLTVGSLVVAVGAEAESSVERITDMVWNLQSGDHGIQQLADRLATVFVPVILVLALVVGGLHFMLGASVSNALLVGLTVLIVSCPCALGLATPLAIASSVRAALDRGIVVFDETIFERLRDVDVVIFDKTGTLTTGEMRVVDSEVAQGAEGPEDLFERAALLEGRSSHPVAAAISEKFEDSPGRSGAESTGDAMPDGGVAEPRQADDSEPGEPENEGVESRVRDFESHVNGVSGVVDGDRLLVGNPELFRDQEWAVSEDIERRAAEARDGGRVPVLVGVDGSAEGLLVVGDDPREGWEDVVGRLADRGVEIAVLTGDDERASASFSDHPDVDHVFAGVPPEAKAETVRQFGAGRQTVMVGDGTNDAPALASADLGIALGSGTALAADAADVAIVSDDLGSIETVFELAGAANRRVKQNIGWAFLYNGVAIPVAVVGILNPLFAAGAMAASSLLVVTNSSRELLDDSE